MKRKRYISPDIYMTKIVSGSHLLTGSPDITVHKDEETESTDLQYSRRRNFWNDEDEEEE